MDHHPTRFPLLRLPLVAIREVLSMINPFEMLNFSLVNPKCKLLGKSCAKFGVHCEYKVWMTIWDNSLSVEFVGSHVHHIFEITSDPEKDGTRKYESDGDSTRDTLLIYAEDRIEEWKRRFEYAREILKLNMEDIYWKLDVFKSENKDIIDWLSSLAPILPRIYLEGRNSEPDDFSYFIQKFQVTKWFQVDIQSNVPWISLENLLRQDCIRLQLRKVDLKAEELGIFLNKWINMECSQRLWKFEVNVKNAEDFETILKDVHHIIGDPERAIEWRRDSIIHKGVDITRKDGVVAKICTFHDMDDVKMIMEIQKPILEE